MNPYLIIAALVSVMGAGWGGFRLGVDHEKAGQIDKQALVSEAVDAANSVAAEAISKLIPKNTTIRQTLEKEIRENTIYSDCKSSPDSVRSFNSAIEPAAIPAGDIKLPATNPTR
nr:hypothetical protein [uncultured Rhodoferax sp.]